MASKRRSSPDSSPAPAGHAGQAPEDLMTISEAVRALGLSERTVRRYVRAGKIGSDKRDGVTVVSLSELAAYTDRSLPRNGEPPAAEHDSTAGPTALSLPQSEEVAWLRRQNEGLHGLLEQLRRDNQRLLSDGQQVLEQVGEAQAAASRFQQEARQLRSEAESLRASLQLSRQSQAWLALLAVAGLVGALLSLFVR